MKSLYILVLIILPFTSAAQAIAGKLMSEHRTIILNQQVGNQQPNVFNISSVFLVVDGKIFSLYGISLEELNSLRDAYSYSDAQQVQVPYRIMYNDYFIGGIRAMVDKFVLVEGDIDWERMIIFNARIVKTFSDAEISKSLNTIHIEEDKD